MNKIKTWINKGGLLFLALMIFTLLGGMAKKPPLVGGPAPQFTLKTLKGESVQISDYHGKVVLLNFWATWCKPCKAEMPEIQAAYEAYKDEGFVVLAINFGEKREKAQKLVKEMGLSFPVLLDRDIEVAERHRVVSLPVTFFVDAKGIIKEQVFGGTLTKDQIGEIFRRLQKKTDSFSGESS